MSDLFGGAAAYYDRGRLPYAPGLADALAGALGLDGRGRLLDVGCGPGTVARRFAHLFESVVGVDADPGMVDAAVAHGVPNATWVHLRAEDLPAGLGSFRVVTFGASFHWMDRPRVAATVRGMLDPDGAVVQVNNPNYRMEVDVIDAVVAAHLPVRGRSSFAGDEDAVFQAAGFAPVEEIAVPDGRVLPRTADDIVAEVFSRSGTAPAVFGEGAAAFEADLRAALGDRTYEVTLQGNGLRIWRPI